MTSGATLEFYRFFFFFWNSIGLCSHKSNAYVSFAYVTLNGKVEERSRFETEGKIRHLCKSQQIVSLTVGEHS